MNEKKNTKCQVFCCVPLRMHACMKKLPWDLIFIKDNVSYRVTFCGYYLSIFRFFSFHIFLSKTMRASAGPAKFWRLFGAQYVYKWFITQAMANWVTANIV